MGNNVISTFITVAALRISRCSNCGAFAVVIKCNESKPWASKMNVRSRHPLKFPGIEKSATNLCQSML